MYLVQLLLIYVDVFLFSLYIEASELTGRELEAQQRDMKRRRQSYKGRTVHTGTKTHTQVIVL